MAKKQKEITAILEASNGFTRRIKIKEMMMRIHIPFMYRLRITDAVLSDRIDLTATPAGEFVLHRKTKTMCFYKLANVVEIANPKFIPQ